MDKFVDCRSLRPGTLGVTQIRLLWQVGAQAGSASWACDDSHGATGFDLPEGVAELSVVPECLGGVPALPATYIAPATIERTVVRGETVSLGAVELVVSVSYCEHADHAPGAAVQPCICCFGVACD